jgi:hypothetical protein
VSTAIPCSYAHCVEAQNCLYLFYSEAFDKEFSSHPLNPVVIDPTRARMGGRFVKKNGKIFRFGQDNSYGYGDGISICEIINISTSDYEERIVGNIKVAGASGPHTVDAFNGVSVFDFYVDKFSLAAWYRRIMPLLLRGLKRR